MIIRAFSWQLRLSPVAFEEFAAALFAPHPSPLLDEVTHTPVPQPFLSLMSFSDLASYVEKLPKSAGASGAHLSSSTQQTAIHTMKTQSCDLIQKMPCR